MNCSQYGTASINSNNSLLAQIDSATTAWSLLLSSVTWTLLWGFGFSFSISTSILPHAVCVCVCIYIGSLESVFQNMWSIPSHDHLRRLGSLSLRCPPNKHCFFHCTIYDITKKCFWVGSSCTIKQVLACIL